MKARLDGRRAAGRIMTKLRNREDLVALRSGLKEEPSDSGMQKVKVCCGTACAAMGSHEVVAALEDEGRKKGLPLDVVKTGCQGMCQKGPVMRTDPENIFYQKVRPEHAGPMISYLSRGEDHFRQGLYREDITSEPIPEMTEIPFYKKQMRVALRNNDKIDPRNIHHYLAVGGYGALEKALFSMTPEEVLHEVDRANLRGRGGAGFPAGQKWRHTKGATGSVKFVIANGDEGDPGAFMDRSIMEGDPHSLFEGMLLCAYATGAQYGFIYVRHEYPLAVKNLRHAIRQAGELGLLGQNILGTGFSFHLDVREGAGAFVCGEASALVASIEGERGYPRTRPPLPSEVGGGVWGYPSTINNIETLACVPVIIEKGAEWFRSIGTESAPGTKVFALTGKVRNTGLIEVPMGTTLREIIFDIGGGILEGRAFKAVQTGGPSGGCIPASHLDLPVDFDSLIRVGSMMGSGGMVVMDEDTCMVDVAKYFLSFTQSESCGKCPPCRIGTYQMLQILERITRGEGRHGDIERLIQLGKNIQKGSLCGLGKSAPNPILSVIKYFREEVEEHVYDRYCRAQVCAGLGVFIINQTECLRCGLCKESCAFDAVKETRDQYFIDRDYCTQCRACYNVCPVQAVTIHKQSVVRLQEQFGIPSENIEVLERSARMTLKDLLQSKPMRVETCSPDCIVADAVTIMDGKNIGSLIVADANGELIGIFTERDIMHCFVKGVQFKNEVMRNVMTPNPITLDASADLGVAINLMSERKIRHLPVTENEKVIGIISYRDVVSYLLPEVIYLSEDIY
ncbi:MAG: NADH-ubiquinone oxidoreductase-F iron-sulfur binding region domain-containing protein [Nitrospirota bacterium]